MSTIVKLRKAVTSAVNNNVSAPVKQGVQTTAKTTAAATRATAQTTRRFVGISRHGILAASRKVDTPNNRGGLVRVLNLLMGSVLIGLGVSLFVRANLGVPAYDVMLTALRDRLGLSLGQAGWLFTGLLLTIAFLLGQRPSVAGVAYILANGIAVDTFIQLIREPDDMAVRLLFVVLGTMSIAAAIALVLHAGLTGGSIELLMRAGQERGLDPFRVRTSIELGIVVLGVLLGRRRWAGHCLVCVVHESNSPGRAARPRRPPSRSPNSLGFVAAGFVKPEVKTRSAANLETRSRSAAPGLQATFLS